MQSLERRLAQGGRSGSYTQRLIDDPSLLRAKLIEEASELAAASTPSDAIGEAADVLYFAMVAMRRSGVSLADVVWGVAASARLTRRPGGAKVETRS